MISTSQIDAAVLILGESPAASKHYEQPPSHGARQYKTSKMEPTARRCVR
jgi:hypothetical protein